MISLEDCIGMCGLDENEVAAISEHEHIPEISAAALASYLLKQPHGGEAIRTMIIDTVPFADMVSLTAFSERSGERAASALTRSLSKLMDDAVREQGGVVQSFTGVAERNGSSRPAICGAEYFISPSAVFSRPVRYPFRYPWPGCAPCS